ncbi:DUF4852 domain-containing protein [Heminiphilus faecis]|uniref:DUF4852 domain-containing protein n=1 Tax=Heminiphilus faecis TaxID=2601703 RepID=UPI001249177C|nr:DUF4852 domain-containing protein [Heminiphilus faecis]
MKTIELMIKKRMKNLTVLLLAGVCLLCQPLQARQCIDACDGRTYKVGDTLRIGEPLSSGYLFVKQLNASNRFEKLNQKNLTGRIAIITDIPAYRPELYRQFGIYQQPETPQIVFAEQGDFKIGVYLNMALSKGNIVSRHHVSHMNGAVDLTPDILFAYAHKLYGKPIDTTSVDTYASLRAPQQYAEAANDPFALEELRTTYRKELEQAVAKADFNKVFRIKCFSKLQMYDINQQHFPLSDLKCIDVETKQDEDLSKQGYCLWGTCAFHFTNAPSFATVPCDKHIAQGVYAMRKMISASLPIPAILYVYVRILQQPVSLPDKRIMVMRPGTSFDYEWSTLSKAWGQKALDLEIIQTDGYYSVFPHNTQEVAYNYLGTQTVPEK